MISSGIDVLENIGKKTYDALAEDDEVLLLETPQNRLTLSQVTLLNDLKANVYGK